MEFTVESDSPPAANIKAHDGHPSLGDDLVGERVRLERPGRPLALVKGAMQAADGPRVFVEIEDGGGRCTAWVPVEDLGPV